MKKHLIFVYLKVGFTQTEVIPDLVEFYGIQIGL